MSMDDKSRLQKWYSMGARRPAECLDFGRVMPFGKYKGTAVYCLLVKHPFYMSWILENTGFKLTETEAWWKAKVDLAIELWRADRLIAGLAGQMHLGGVSNIENPHWIVE